LSFVMQATLGPFHPDIHPTAWIAPSADVIGQVCLGADVSVWFGAVIRADNDSITIGSGSNLQDGAVIHVDAGFPCSVGEFCVVGHRAVLHGCRLGNEVLIGIGAIVLNGAVVPDGCLIGAGALVPEGKVLESDCLYVGVPARKVRALAPEERARIRRNAEGYIARARHFAAELKPV
jgi:carbonic anhydrase/acetyltransferase-like protein (isoleucine patch superfamily)